MTENIKYMIARTGKIIDSLEYVQSEVDLLLEEFNLILKSSIAMDRLFPEESDMDEVDAIIGIIDVEIMQKLERIIKDVKKELNELTTHPSVHGE